ncbi:MAG: hypothetical protein ACFE0R_13845 [Salinarimonas sp.]
MKYIPPTTFPRSPSPDEYRGRRPPPTVVVLYLRKAGAMLTVVAGDGGFVEANNDRGIMRRSEAISRALRWQREAGAEMVFEYEEPQPPEEERGR